MSARTPAKNGRFLEAVEFWRFLEAVEFSSTVLIAPSL